MMLVRFCLPAPGSSAQGIVVRGLSEADLARLDFCAALFGARRGEATVLAPSPEAVSLWFRAHPATSDPWSLEDWAARWGEVTVATVADAMALFGQADPTELHARMPQMMVRAASRLRATGSAASLRRRADPADVNVLGLRQPYARFFAIEEYDLRFRRFDGTMHDQVSRAAFLSGDAVTVLPYDPVRDRVLLIEQFRVGAFARGDDQPWLLEAIAGRIDAGETPEEAARREAVEEAGLDLGELVHVANYYPTPGAKAEYLYTFVAPVDLPDTVSGTFGLADEAEDIRVHLIGFDQAMDLVATGEINNGPLLITLLWLQRERARLRGYSR